MRRLLLVVCLVGLALGVARPSNAAATYVWGAGPANWTDVNKTNPSPLGSESLYCWAASAADVLSWTHWWGWDSGTSSYLDTAAEIYAKIISTWPNSLGSSIYADEWWMTDRSVSGFNASKTFPSQGLDFYPTVNFGPSAIPGNDVGHFEPDTANNIRDKLDYYISTGRGLSIAVENSYSYNTEKNTGTADCYSGGFCHALTVWGWNPSADLNSGEIYVTDSDDGATQLRTFTYDNNAAGELWIHSYTNAYISTPEDLVVTQITRLNRNIDPTTGLPIDPNRGPGPGGEVPEPATLTLLGLGLAYGLRKRWNA